MKNTIHLTPESTLTYHYKPEQDLLSVQLRASSGTVESEAAPNWEHIQILREQPSGEVVGFTISSVQQMVLEQLVRSLTTALQPYFDAAPVVAPPGAAATETEGTATPDPASRRPSRRKSKKSPQAEAISELEAISEGLHLTPAEASDTLRSEGKPGEGDGEVELGGELAAQAEGGDLRQPSDIEGNTVESAPKESAVPVKKSRSRRGKAKSSTEATEAEYGRDTAVTPPVDTVAAKSPAGSVEDVINHIAEVFDTNADEGAEAGPPTAPKPKSRSRRRKKEAPDKAEVEAGLTTSSSELVRDASSPEVDTSAPTLGDPEAIALESEQEDTSPDGVEAAAGEGSKRRRRKRRKRRSGSESPTAASGAISVPPPVPARHTHYVAPPAPKAEVGAVRPGRSSYKSEPIEGLDAPEEFQFMGLDPLIGQALHALGYESPTAIQRRAVPDAMQQRDLVGLAQTGTGKTMAFLLPSLHRMLKSAAGGHRPRLLVLTPTRELALQVATEAEYLATHTDFRIAAIYGQEDIQRQIRQLRDGLDVVVATPGRLLDHLQRGTVRLNEVEVLVLDEADRMLDMGFLPDVRRILSRLPAERQTMMFSATMPQAVQSLSLDFQRNPVVIEVARQLPPAQIDQKLYPVERHLKIPLLEHLLKQDPSMRSVMVFTETKAEADIVHRKLTEMGLKPVIMHGDISQRERERALGQLRDGTARTLVATNVAARGLDIQDVTHVINYEVPQTVDDYVHRIGRTARGEGVEGTAITFVSSGDNGMIMRIESALERTLPRVFEEGFNYDVPTPSWAKPSADNIAESLNKPKNLAERFGRMMRRR